MLKQLLFTTLPALACGSAYAQVGLGLSPMRLEFVLAPGVIQAGTLMVSNEATVPVRFRAELLDFYIDQEDTPQFAPSYPNEAVHSCRGWLSLNPMEAEVPPQSSMKIRYTLRVPSNATSRSFHCAAGFTTLAAASQLSGTGLKTAVRMVSVFYAVIGQPQVVGELTRMAMEYVKGAEGPQWRAVVVVKNGGDKYFRANGDLAVLDEKGSVVESSKFPLFPVLPQREQRFLFPLKKVAAQHTYTLRARVDLGTPEIQEAVATVVAPQPEK